MRTIDRSDINWFSEAMSPGIQDNHVYRDGDGNFVCHSTNQKQRFDWVSYLNYRDFACFALAHQVHETGKPEIIAVRFCFRTAVKESILAESAFTRSIPTCFPTNEAILAAHEATEYLRTSGFIIHPWS